MTASQLAPLGPVRLLLTPPAASAAGLGKPAPPEVRVRPAACTPRTHGIGTHATTPSSSRPRTALRSELAAVADPLATAADASHPGDPPAESQPSGPGVDHPIRRDRLRRGRVPTTRPMAPARVSREVPHAPSNRAPEPNAPHARPVEPLCKQEVAGSIPAGSIARKPCSYAGSECSGRRWLRPQAPSGSALETSVGPRVVHVPPGGPRGRQAAGLPS
jgi:hypothetical protein